MMLENLSSDFKASLEDIVTKIEISNNFQISHQDYHPVIVSQETIARLQQLAKDFQKQYLVGQLGNYLADIYFHGCLHPISSELNESQLSLANNSIKGVNLNFYEQLTANNYSQGYFDPDWLVIAKEKKAGLKVQKNGLTLQIKRDRHLQEFQRNPKLKDLVAIKLPNNRWQDEFYVAVSDRGLVEVDSQQQILEIYFNINPDGAIILLRELTQQLNKNKIVFTLKILDQPDNYPRYDAVILRFYQEDYLRIFPVIKNIYPNLISYLHQEIPICTFKLADGIALAEAIEGGFANTCSRAIATGLLTAWNQGDDSPNNRLKCIRQFIHWQKTLNPVGLLLL